MLFYTQPIYPGQGTGRERRPGPRDALPYRSTGMPRGRVRVVRGGIGGQFKCDFYVLSVPAAVGPIVL